MSSNSKQTNSKQLASIDRFLVKTRGIDTTPSRDQGPTKRSAKWSEIVANKQHEKDSPAIDEPNPPAITKTLPLDPETQPNKEKEKKTLPTTTESLSSDDEDGDDDFEIVTNSGFPIRQESYQNPKAFSHRFIVNMEINNTGDPKSIMKNTVKFLNQIMVKMQNHLQFHGPGKMILFSTIDSSTVLRFLKNTKFFSPMSKCYSGITWDLMVEKLRLQLSKSTVGSNLQLCRKIHCRNQKKR